MLHELLSKSSVRGNREDLMDRATRCPKCGKRMVPVVTISGRTELQCISCDDPAVKWAQSPLTVPDKPVAAERVSTERFRSTCDVSLTRCAPKSCRVRRKN